MDRTQKRTDRQQLTENIKKKTAGASAVNDVRTSHRCAVITSVTKQTFISSFKSGSYFFAPHLRVQLYHKNPRNSTVQWSPNTQYVLCELPRNRSNTERNVVTAPAIYLCSSCTSLHSTAAQVLVLRPRYGSLPCTRHKQYRVQNP